MSKLLFYMVIWRSSFICSNLRDFLLKAKKGGTMFACWSYGFKQSPRQWYKRFWLTTHGYSRNMYDSCVYFRKLSYGFFILFPSYMLMICSLPQGIYLKSTSWSHCWVMNLRWKTFGQQRRSSTWKLRGTEKQENYIEESLKAFSFWDAKPVMLVLH